MLRSTQVDSVRLTTQRRNDSRFRLLNDPDVLSARALGTLSLGVLDGLAFVKAIETGFYQTAVMEEDVASLAFDEPKSLVR